MIINWLKNEESGQGMVEYGLILVLISVVAIVALGGIGSKLKTNFTAIDKKLEEANDNNIGDDGSLKGTSEKPGGGGLNND